ncbi:MAG TPA: thioesterase family protein [Acidimicrobiales bacterium]|nr:thioesterase family protein [Acidimicrobiales bacterium]
MSETEFEADTAVHRADGAWAADISPRWSIGSNPNGGYLTALAARAMIADAGHPDPWSVTAHFLSPPAPGPAWVRTEVAKAGRTYSTVSATLVQGDRERVRLLGAFGDLSARTGPTRVATSPPDIPPPEQCVSLREVAGQGPDPAGFPGRIDLRLPPEVPWGGRGPEDGPFEIVGWIRFPGGPEPTVLSLLAFADAYPPTLIGALEVGWVPTIELTVHVRARPQPGWLLGAFQTRLLVDGLLEEDGQLWDSAGRPVAQSRQLAMVLPPRQGG